MKRISTSLALIIGLINLAPVLSADTATIVPFADDPRCRRYQIRWVFTPVGMGIVDLRVDPRSAAQCSTAGGSGASFIGGGIGGGGGFGGFPGGGLPGFVNAPFDLESDNQFELEPDETPLLFTGDTLPPGISDGGNGGPTGFSGGGPGFPPDSSLMSLLNDDPEQGLPGNSSPPLTVEDHSLTAVPEPGSIFLLATGLVLTVRHFRRR